MNSPDPFRCFHRFAESVSDAASGISPSWKLPSKTTTETEAVPKKILLAVSGGADSVAMFHCVRRLDGVTPDQLIVAHFDHGVRPDSASDAAWVRQLAETSGVQCVIGSRNAADLADNDGYDDSEDALRRARYLFLEREAHRFGVRTVWTAHTLDDQIETVLHRILRGTGLRGLTGIPVTRPFDNGNGDSMEQIRIFRPMLQIDRLAIVDFLREIGQPWREDATNAATDYTRNRIRHELLPLIESRYASGVRRSLARLATLANDAVRHLDTRIARWYDQVIRIETETVPANTDSAENRTTENTTVRVDRASLADQESELIRELLRRIWRECRWPQREMGFDHWNTLAGMLHTGSPRRRMFPGGILATVRRHALELTHAPALIHPAGTKQERERE